MDDGVRGRCIHMSKEELEKKLSSVGIFGEWVDKDKYGFSRVFQFTLGDQIIKIEWYCNYSTLMIGNAHFWFDRISISNKYPYRGEWIEFSFRGEHPVYLKVKQEDKNMYKISEENKETAKYYGYEAQSNQLVEECAELIQAVNKYRRVETGLGQPVAEDKKAIARDNLVEEIADVELMLEQVKYLLQIPEDELLAVKTFKVNRTRERMESSK